MRWKAAAAAIVRNSTDSHAGLADQQRVYTVFRQPGSWRRELISNGVDALTAMNEKDLKILSKAAKADFESLATKKKSVSAQSTCLLAHIRIQPHGLCLPYSCFFCVCVCVFVPRHDQRPQAEEHVRLDRLR
jgi:hypothetical protein